MCTRLRLRERAAHLEHPRFEAQILPLETQKLPAPESGGDGQNVEGFVTVPGFGGAFKETADLFGVERPYLFFARARGLDRSCGVAGHEAVVVRLLERLAKGSVDVQDGAGATSFSR